jgi:hypothetical protein
MPTRAERDPVAAFPAEAQPYRRVGASRQCAMLVALSWRLKCQCLAIG